MQKFVNVETGATHSNRRAWNVNTGCDPYFTRRSPVRHSQITQPLEVIYNKQSW